MLAEDNKIGQRSQHGNLKTNENSGHRDGIGFVLERLVHRILQTLLQEIKEDPLNKWKTSHVHQ